MKDLLLFIDNKEKISIFLGLVPLYVYLIIILIIILLIYFFFRSKASSKIVSGGSINIEGNGNTVIK